MPGVPSTETISDLQARLVAQPADCAARLVLADILEEAGDSDCEYQRWVVSLDPRAWRDCVLVDPHPGLTLSDPHAPYDRRPPDWFDGDVVVSARTGLRVIRVRTSAFEAVMREIWSRVQE